MSESEIVVQTTVIDGDLSVGNNVQVANDVAVSGDLVVNGRIINGGSEGGTTVDVSGKIDKLDMRSSTAGNFPKISNSGGLFDSGDSPNSFSRVGHTHDYIPTGGLKTVNGQSLEGTGDIVISGSGEIGTGYEQTSNKLTWENSDPLDGDSTDLNYPSAKLVGKALELYPKKPLTVTNGNFPKFNSNGNLVDSGYKPTDFVKYDDLGEGGTIDVSGKADKVSSSTAGHLASLTSEGNLADSGKAASDFVASPANAGSSGQVLSLDVSLNPVWVTPSSGSTLDDNVTENSPNPVKSSGIYSAISSATSDKATKVSGSPTNHLAKLTSSGDLADSGMPISISSPTSGQVLKYNGTSWVNAAESGGGGGGASALRDLSDVQLTTPKKNDFLLVSAVPSGGNPVFSNATPAINRTELANASFKERPATCAAIKDALDQKASTSHNHNGTYSPVGHDHSGVYEPTINKVTTFERSVNNITFPTTQAVSNYVINNLGRPLVEAVRVKYTLPEGGEYVLCKSEDLLFMVIDGVGYTDGAYTADDRAEITASFVFKNPSVVPKAAFMGGDDGISTGRSEGLTISNMEIHIPSFVHKLDDHAFAFAPISLLEFEGMTPPDFGERVFKDVPAHGMFVQVHSIVRSLYGGDHYLADFYAEQEEDINEYLITFNTHLM